MCIYQGRHFGAHYDDATCIDGYLWDLDSGGEGEDGQYWLDHGGDIPCPNCKPADYIRYYSDDFVESGYESLDHPLTTKMVKNVFADLSSNHRRVANRYWRQGRRDALREALLEG